MNKVRILTEDMQDKNFYAEMGPYFASLDIKKELENQIYNKEGSTWFLLYNKSELLGFCAIFELKNYLYLDNFYILTEHRGNKYSNILFESILKYTSENYSGLKIKSITKTPEMFYMFEKNNFIHTGNNGRYRKYERI